MEYYDEVVEIKQKPDITEKNNEAGILKIPDDDDISILSSTKQPSEVFKFVYTLLYSSYHVSYWNREITYCLESLYRLNGHRLNVLRVRLHANDYRWSPKVSVDRIPTAVSPTTMKTKRL